MLGKVIFGCKVVATTLFVVATSYVVRELDFFLRVYVASETSGTFVGWAGVTCTHSFILVLI